MLARHALTILAVRDLEEAVRFYREAFGWEQTVAAPVYAEFTLPDGMRFGLYEREAFARNVGALPDQTPAGSISSTELYFYADQPHETLASLRGAGARELSPWSIRDWGDEAAYFADPDGNVLVIAREATR